jgi:hypothetical protein
LTLITFWIRTRFAPWSGRNEGTGAREEHSLANFDARGQDVPDRLLEPDPDHAVPDQVGEPALGRLRADGELLGEERLERVEATTDREVLDGVDGVEVVRSIGKGRDAEALWEARDGQAVAAEALTDLV